MVRVKLHVMRWGVVGRRPIDTRTIPTCVPPPASGPVSQPCATHPRQRHSHTPVSPHSKTPAANAHNEDKRCVVQRREGRWEGTACLGVAWWWSWNAQYEDLDIVRDYCHDSQRAVTTAWWSHGHQDRVWIRVSLTSTTIFKSDLKFQLPYSRSLLPPPVHPYTHTSQTRARAHTHTIHPTLTTNAG